MTITTTEPPSIQQQRAAALLGANDTRKCRSELKAKLRQEGPDARAHMARLVLDPPAYLNTARILDVLSWVPGIKWTRAALILEKADVKGGLRTVGELTDRKRHAIAEQLGTSPLAIFSPPDQTPSSEPEESPAIFDDIAV